MSQIQKPTTTFIGDKQYFPFVRLLPPELGSTPVGSGGGRGTWFQFRDSASTRGNLVVLEVEVVVDRANLGLLGWNYLNQLHQLGLAIRQFWPSSS